MLLSRIVLFSGGSMDLTTVLEHLRRELLLDAAILSLERLQSKTRAAAGRPRHWPCCGSRAYVTRLPASSGPEQPARIELAI